MPAAAETVYEYLAYLSLYGAVKPQLWMQYVAVTNSVHRDLGLPTPWMESGLCASFVRSASILVTSAAPEHPSRKPLLAAHLLLFLSVAMFRSDLNLVRSTVAVTLAFLSFVRGASLTSLLSSDVKISLPSTEVVVWDEKTRKGSGIARSVSILCADCVLVGQLIQNFLAMPLQSFSGWCTFPEVFCSFLGSPSLCLKASLVSVCSSVLPLLA